jgi:hypothetical protein
VLTQIKSVYILWNIPAAKLPKTTRYSLGLKIDNLFIDTIEVISIAAFMSRADKIPYLKRAITRVDTLKVFLQMLWEMKLLDTKSYGEISEKLSEVGKMLGGWYGQVIKQNSTAGTGEK